LDYETTVYKYPEVFKIEGFGAVKFNQNSKLHFWLSLAPLLKNPFRQDIRLYFDHVPKINNYGPDAWAINETGKATEWKLKIHN